MLVVTYAPPRVHAIELAAIYDTLAYANRESAVPAHYDLRIVAEENPLRCASGLLVSADALYAVCEEPADMLIVAASDSGEAAISPALTAWLARQAGGAARYGSIGNGAFLLGAAGLLDGRRVTTHWECARRLADACPAAEVEADSIFVRDGPLFSCAGGMATIDLLLALVEEDHGREFALQAARHFVLFMKRAGAQSQVSLQLKTQVATRDPIQRVQKHIRDHPEDDLSVAALAAVAAMSPRNFARVFVQETGMRPADYVEILRVNLARRMLEDNALPAPQIARLCGFSGTEAARRAFRRRVGLTMAEFRAGLSGRGV